MHRRLPHRRGFTPLFKKDYAIVNLSALERFDDGTTVTPEVLIEAGIIASSKDGIKILGDGTLTKKLTVRANHFSKSASDKISALGGAAETL